MKLPLGLLIDEGIPECRETVDLHAQIRWIRGIQLTDGDDICQDDILYVILDGCSIPKDTALQDRLLLIGHKSSLCPLKATSVFFTVPDSCGLLSVYKRLQNIFLSFHEWYLRMSDACAFRCRLQDLLDLSECMTPNHIYVADMSFRILAYTDKEIMPQISATWRYQLAHGYLPVHVMKGMIESHEFERLNGFHTAGHFYSENFYVPFVTKNIFYHNRPQAHLFVVDAIKRPNFRDLAVAQVLGDFLEKHYTILEEFKRNCTINSHEAFFRDVLRGVCADKTVISRQISLFDWKMDDTYTLTLIRTDDRDENFCRIIMYHLEENPGLKCLIYGTGLIVIMNRTQTGHPEVIRKFKEISEKYDLEICMGNSFRGFLNIITEHEFLIRITQIAHLYDDSLGFFEAADYSLFYIIDCISKTAELDQLCSSDALLLKDYDQKNGTDYFETYLTYLGCDRNIVRTSKILHIHRNTLMYRLDKIHELLSVDEEKFVQKIHLFMSMLLIRHHEVIENSRKE